jgi:transcriptional regulator with XRE-family HTH domain
MKERLLKFLEDESLTAAKFADEIGVQRSSISHILSGRNNPGYDFFQKVLKRYPQLNAEWLIMGTGRMNKAMQQASLFEVSPDSPQEEEISKVVAGISESLFKEKEAPTVQSAINPNFSHESVQSLAGRNIEKIIILYSDRSFKEYLPSK